MTVAILAGGSGRHIAPRPVDEDFSRNVGLDIGLSSLRI
jgi:hypothetical protein